MKRSKQFDIRRASVCFHYWFDEKMEKIKLAPGQRIAFHAHSTTEEGWSSERVEFSFKHRVIHMHRVTDERDCDGRLTQNEHLVCRLHDRAKIRRHRFGMEKASRKRVPLWESVEFRQRDENAERMGY